MGLCLDCLQNGQSDESNPDPEERRAKAAEAALKRQQANESKGIKDPEGLKRKQQKREELEKKAETADRDSGGGLTWQVG